MVPAETFDNVKGKFPIGFFIWNTEINDFFEQIDSDVFDKNGTYIGSKTLHSYNNCILLTQFGKNKANNQETLIGHFAARGNDFQNQTGVFIDNIEKIRKGGGLHINILHKNFIEVSISFSVRNCIPATWLNDRDQFLFPNDNWKTDAEFQNDCLAFTLFQINIQSQYGTNHWIPFTEKEVNAKEKFASSFMTDFISGKIKIEVQNEDLFSAICQPELVSGSPEIPKQVRNDKALVFSPEATAVFDAGRALWSYFHSQNEVNVNASLYDIREYFQGRNAAGRMNPRSDDATYSELIGNLRKKLTELADKIKPKVYEYEFLKE